MYRIAQDIEKCYFNYRKNFISGTMLFITFEGLDFSGKTTQLQLLAQRLEGEGISYLIVREPGGTKIGEKIRAILLDADNRELTVASELFLFEASRSQLVEEVIKPALDRGTVVLCDRYFDSTTAYQGYGRGLSLELIKAINRFATAGLEPHITFFIDIPVEELENRIQRTHSIRDRMELNEREFYDRVRKGYLELAYSEKRFRVLNGVLSINELHSRIWDEVCHFISVNISKTSAVKKL
ncbi:MAG: dTMP kinase [Bacteroidetes bacterium]|nr:dTMP kinase [Bacteroidota bacterium]